MRGVCLDTITSHPISQWDVVRFGGKSCGLELSAGPPQFFKMLVENEGGRQRESCLHCFKYLSVPPEVVFHVPRHHQNIVSRIYENLKQPHKSGDTGAAHRVGDYHVHYDRNMLKSVIKVVSADKDLCPEILRATRSLFEYAGTEVVYLDLPLAQPASVPLCELLKERDISFQASGRWKPPMVIILDCRTSKTPLT